MKTIIINADDFGMAPAINEAIVNLFELGVVDSASLMVPVPAFDAAAELARSHHIPCGVHLVLASDWDMCRFRPLTRGSTLVTQDGYFPPHVRDLDAAANRDEVEAECSAQIERVIAQGLAPTHIDSHIAPFNEDILARLSRRYDLPCRDLLRDYPERMCQYESLFHLTPIEHPHKLSALIEWLTNLPAGQHICVVHPAVDDAALLSMCSERLSGRRRWLREFRVSDYEVLSSPTVRTALSRFDGRHSQGPTFRILGKHHS